MRYRLRVGRDSVEILVRMAIYYRVDGTEYVKQEYHWEMVMLYEDDTDYWLRPDSMDLWAMEYVDDYVNVYEWTRIESYHDWNATIMFGDNEHVKEPRNGHRGDRYHWVYSNLFL